jgi:hypothetical protein
MYVEFSHPFAGSASTFKPAQKLDRQQVSDLTCTYRPPHPHFIRLDDAILFAARQIGTARKYGGPHAKKTSKFLPLCCRCHNRVRDYAHVVRFYRADAAGPRGPASHVTTSATAAEQGSAYAGNWYSVLNRETSQSQIGGSNGAVTRRPRGTGNPRSARCCANPIGRRLAGSSRGN